MTPLRGDTLCLPIFSPAPHKPRKLKENKTFTIPQPHTPKTPPPQHSATPHPPPIGRALIPQPGSTPRGPTAAPTPAQPKTPDARKRVVQGERVSVREHLSETRIQ